MTLVTQSLIITIQKKMENEKINAYARSHPLSVSTRIAAVDIFFNTVTPPPSILEMHMTFRLPIGRLEPIECLAMAYTQFDDYMKERYGEVFDEYIKSQKKRIENGIGKDI